MLDFQGKVFIPEALQLDWGLNGTVGGATVIFLFLQGTRRNLDDSPLFSCGGSSLATPTAPQMRAESMRGTMSPLGGNLYRFY